MSLQRFGHSVLALLILAILPGFAPVGAYAAAPHQISLKPATARSLQAAVAGSTTLQREVFGFALASSLSDPTVGYPSWNFSLLSTVAFFGLHVQDDGTFAADAGSAVWNSAQLTGLLSTAHSYGTKVVLTIILQDFAAGTPHMCSALAHAATTIANTVAEVRAKGVDGVNVDYEGLNGSCGSATDSSAARHGFTAFVAGLRAGLPAGSYLSVDTYASSATDPLGFFDVSGLAPSADSFFVMAYDLEYSNYSRAPAGCASFCLGPTAPLTGYYYNDTSTSAQYAAVVPASKVILGVPYYGRKACVSAATPNQYPTGPVVADTYLDATGESAAAGVRAGSFVAHRDANDPAGQERWDTWFNTTMNCTRELYWDDAASLGLKYDLVNRDNLRGVGIWNLNYGGGAPELWQLLSSKFATTTPWASLGGALNGGPDVASWGATRADVFMRGSDNQLYHAAWDATGWHWESLGGALASDPGAVSMAPNRIDVFVRGTDNNLWHRWFDGTKWYGYENLGGGGLSSGPDVASWGNNRLDIFVRGSDNQLWHRWWDGIAWRPWEPLGGVLASDPTAVSWGPNRIDVFARGTDNQLWHKWWDGIAWRPWEPLGGGLTSSPDAASCASGHLDVFATGPDSSLYQRGFKGSAGWGPWVRMGGQWTSSPGAVCAAGTSLVGVYERGPDGALWHTSVPAS
jgi:spore germination protein YaaH